MLLWALQRLYCESAAARSPGCCPSKSSGRGWGRGEYGLTGSGPSPSGAHALQSPVTEQARGATGTENTCGRRAEGFSDFYLCGPGANRSQSLAAPMVPTTTREPPLTSHPLVLSCGNPPRFTIFT